MNNLVGYVLLNEHIVKRVCEPDGPDGSVGEQSGYIEAFGDLGWRCIGIVVHVSLVLLIDAQKFAVGFGRSYIYQGQRFGVVPEEVFVQHVYFSIARRHGLDGVKLRHFLVFYLMDYSNAYGLMTPCARSK